MPRDCDCPFCYSGLRERTIPAGPPINVNALRFVWAQSENPFLSSHKVFNEKPPLDPSKELVKSKTPDTDHNRNLMSAVNLSEVIEHSWLNSSPQYHWGALLGEQDSWTGNSLERSSETESDSMLQESDESRKSSSSSSFSVVGSDISSGSSSEVQQRPPPPETFVRFKAKKPFEERRKEMEKLRQSYPNKVPVIVERYSREKSLPHIPKSRFLVPREITCSQFVTVIRNRMKISSSQSIYLLVNDNTLVSLSRTIAEIYQDCKDDDGFLYITYASQEVFGS